MTTAPVELVHVHRSGLHESTHYGSVAITAADGSLEFALGDVSTPMFPRSSNKPFQAAAMLECGADLRDADLALAAASHSGEPMHVDRAFAMLARANLTEDDLGCPPALPLDEGARRTVLLAAGEARRIFMNCSGKHAGMLTAAVRNGWSTADYLDPAHPLQRRVVKVVARLTRQEPAAVGIDGCGAPLFAVSLAALARAFGTANAAPDGTPERRVADAMRAFPEMVGGSGRDDTRLMRAFPGLLDEFAVGVVLGGGEPVGTVTVTRGLF